MSLPTYESPTGNGAAEFKLHTSADTHKPGSTEFQQFAEFTERLVNVPKTEIDALRERES